MYKYFTQFVPKDTPPRDAKQIMAVEFTHDSLNKSEVESKAYETARTSKGVDRYALRNHWEIFQTEVQYDNPPWNKFDELVSELMSYDDTKEWMTVENRLHIVVDKNSISDYIKNIKSYYSPLNPRMKTDGVVTVDQSPRLD